MKNMLRKTVVAVIAIALLRIITFILDRFSPASSAFHRQFLFSLQLTVVFWLLVSLLLIAFKAGKSWVARFLPILIVMVVLAVDILFSFWMENPSKIPGFLKNEFKNYIFTTSQMKKTDKPFETVFDFIKKCLCTLDQQKLKN